MSTQILPCPTRARNGQPTTPEPYPADLAQVITAAEILIFYCENRLAKSHPHRRFYWQKQLAAAWRNLARCQRRAGVK